MAEISADELERLFERVGARLSQPGSLYVLGGSALVLLGSVRRTLDLDFVGSDIPPRAPDELQNVLAQVASEMRIGIEPVPLYEFIPIPGDAESRHRRIGQYGQLTVFVFDPYSIALSKIGRGFKTDLDDVEFLGREGVISFSQLEQVVQSALPRAREFDMDGSQMLARLEMLRGQF